MLWVQVIMNGGNTLQSEIDYKWMEAFLPLEPLGQGIKVHR